MNLWFQTRHRSHAGCRLSAALLSAALLAAAGCAREPRNDAPQPQTGRATDALPETRSADPPPAATAAESVPPHEREDPADREPFPPRRPQPPPVDGPPQPVFRFSEVRRQFDEALLERAGIRRYASSRLRLYTDLDPDVARTLPPVIDAAYAAWEDYFGPLPPSRERAEYQLTGFIMRDQAAFRETGLLPPDLPEVVHGRHRGSEFWMNDQGSDYYRRHLMIHEATHCFMAARRDDRNWPPAWYAEGMAELFGTHRIEPDGSVRFRVMPHNEADFLGQGRIRVLRDEAEAGRFKPVREVFEMATTDYLRTYSWSWGLCAFLDGHPRYRERFRALGGHIGRRQFLRALEESFREDRADLETEWALFVHSLQAGYDLERAAIDFREGMPVTETAECRIAAGRGWQSSGILVEAGADYEVTAAGRFTLADHPQPWVSEPQGVSLRYAHGRPLGELHAAIRSVDPMPHVSGPGSAVPGEAAESMLDVIPVGRRARLRPAVTGTLYLRINDSWSELADNRGEVQVQVRRAAANDQ